MSPDCRFRFSDGGVTKGWVLAVVPANEKLGPKLEGTIKRSLVFPERDAPPLIQPVPYITLLLLTKRRCILRRPLMNVTTYLIA